MTIRNIRFRRLALAAATFNFMSNAGAMAQEAGNEPTAPPSVTQLDSITVTAQKRVESARDVPASISVVDSQQVERQHITQLSDLNGYIPSMQVTSSGTPGQTAVSLRGIPTIGESAVVATYIDDSPLGSSSNFSRAGNYVLELTPYDIERIEVLPGPQGTLYGASSMGGLLKYVLTEPDLEYREGRIGGGIARVAGAGGSGWNVRASGNLPLLKDELAVRASFSRQSTPGWVDNVVTGRKGINDGYRQSTRLTALWVPAEDLRLKFTALRQIIDTDDNTMIPLDPATRQPRVGRDSTDKQVEEPFRKTVDFYAANLSRDLSWAEFVSASSYSKTASRQTSDQTASFGALLQLPASATSGISDLEFNLDLKKWTQEFRLGSKTDGDIEWLLGFFYTKEQAEQQQRLGAKMPDGSAMPFLDPLLALHMPSRYYERAAFGNLTYRFSERFDITAGLRHARNRQTYEQSIDAGVLLPVGTTHRASEQNVTTYLFSPRFHLTDDSMLYARVASGYRPGGPNVSHPGVPPSVKEDTLVNYEIGMKSLFLDRRASVDVSVYRINWKDIQLLTRTDTGIGYLANGGAATSEGAELTTAFKLTPDLILKFNASYTDAHLTQDVPALSGMDGDPLPMAPRWTAALLADYTFALPGQWNGHLGAGYAFVSARNAQVEHSPLNYRIGSSGQANLNADIGKGAWTIRLYAKNLTNDRTYANVTALQNVLTGQVGLWTASLPQPRTLGLEFDLQY